MTKTILPKVSIIIPVYNGSNYMKEAIDSALNQTYKDIEIIVVNDGSNDNGETEKIALSYGSKIRYFKKENGGVSTALNLAISKMSGKYFSWLSHDDVYYPNKIEAQINYLIDNNLVNKNIILYADYDVINEKSKVFDKCFLDHNYLINKGEYSLLKRYINGLTLLIPKKAFDEFGLFNEKLRCVQDYDMWYRMSKKYKFIHMEGIFVKSRQHIGQVTFTNPNVSIEGNNLFIEMIKDVPTKLMEKLEGSVCQFYKEMVDSLKNSPYDEALQFCKQKYDETNQDSDISKIEKKKNNIIFKNPIKIIKKYGPKIAIKKIINNIKKS
ncbi:MAG: glycosyltransferase [Bacilli bacterium]|jgi:hypothetical protein